MQRRAFPFALTALTALSLAGLCAPALAQAGKDVKIALLAGKTGPLEAYAKQTSVGS